MNNLRSIFESFYNHFILRDLFGKIVPGSIFSITIYLCLAINSSLSPPTLSDTKDIPLMAWLGIYGLFWLIGFAIQSFGEKWQLIKYYPSKHFSNDFQFFEFRARFLLKAEEYEKSQLERFVVIKESCGNGHVSLLLSIVMVAVFSAISLWSYPKSHLIDALLYYKFYIVTLAVASVAAYYLRQMHLIFMNRQYEYMTLYVEKLKSDVAVENA